MYEIKTTKKFDKDIKSLSNHDINLLKEVILTLQQGNKLPVKNRDHQLNNSKHYKDCRECHIKPNLLLVYKIDKGALILELIRVGSHSKLGLTNSLSINKGGVLNG